jgi:nuclear pore complex protein Nup107
VNRVSLKSIISYKTNFPMPQELDDMTAWIEEYLSQQEDMEVMTDESLPGRTESYLVKVVWQLESLVKALDSIETLASMAHLIRRLVSPTICCA